MIIPAVRRLFQLATRPFRGEDAVDEEIAFHLESQVTDLVKRGWSAEAARAEAHRRFGSVPAYRQGLVAIGRRLVRRHRWRDKLVDAAADLRYLGRSLRKAPAFTGGVILTLGLGIGVNASMVGLVDRLLFKPPTGIMDPDQVVRYSLTRTAPGFGPFTSKNATWQEFDLIRQGAQSVSQVAAFYSGQTSLGRGEEARAARITAVTPSFFGTLGVRPQLGRFFGPDEDPVAGGAGVVVISDGLWRSEFGGRKDVLGQTLVIGSERVAVIGVTPRYFTGVDLDRVEAWLPMHGAARPFVGPPEQWADSWDWQWLEIVARLAPGATRQSADAEGTALYRAEVADLADRHDDQGVVRYFPVIAARGAEPGRGPMVVALLAGISLLLLLITCANVASLVLARGAARQREIAVRLALGIERSRLVRLLLTESAVLATLGAVVGLGVAYGVGSVVQRWSLTSVDLVEPPVDLRLVCLTLAIAAMAALAVGLLPALHLARPAGANGLTIGDADGRGAGRQVRRVHRALLLIQGALSVLILICAGLFTKSFRRVSALDFGFEPRGVLVADIDLTLAGYTRDRYARFYDEAQRRLASTAGVSSVSLATVSPFQTRQRRRVTIPGRDSLSGSALGTPYYSVVTPEYFTTVGLRLARGRGLTDADRPEAPTVAVVNQVMAEAFWPGADPIGQCLIVIGDGSSPCRTVVGVVADPFATDLDLSPTMAYYLPLAQAGGLSSGRYLFIKAKGDPGSLLIPIQKAIQTMAPNLPAASVRLFQDQIDPLFRPWRLGSALFGAMGVLALVIVAVGLFSVLSYTVAQRSREFGIRTALGARGNDIVRLVMLEGQRIAGAGVAVGAGLALLASPLIASMLFHTSARDPFVYVGAVVTLIATTAVGSLVPARRAAQTRPMTALRSD